jgi:hypothetical protein
MLSKSAVLDTHDVGHDPIHRLSDPRKPAVEHDKITIGGRQGILVTQFFWHGFDEPEKPVTARRDMSAVLNIVGDQNSCAAL